MKKVTVGYIVKNMGITQNTIIVDYQRRKIDEGCGTIGLTWYTCTNCGIEFHATKSRKLHKNKFCCKDCELEYHGADMDKVKTRRRFRCKYADDDVKGGKNRRCTKETLPLPRLAYLPIYDIEDVCSDCEWRREP